MDESHHAFGVDEDGHAGRTFLTVVEPPLSQLRPIAVDDDIALEVAFRRLLLHLVQRDLL